MSFTAHIFLELLLCATSKQRGVVPALVEAGNKLNTVTYGGEIVCCRSEPQGTAPNLGKCSQRK